MTTAADNGVMEVLTRYMVESRTRILPAEVALKAKHHILDTIAAMVSGANLEPGRLASRYARGLGGPKEATVVQGGYKTGAAHAALANGMLAHSDETDDSHTLSGMHPGCAILPAALAMAETHKRSGTRLLNAVVLGYDVGCRVMHALNPSLRDKGRFYSEKGVGGVFGAAAAAGCLTDMDADQMRYMFGYAGQQASGIPSYMTDKSHVEKAFAFGGMPARNGVASATMAAAGLTGEWDVFQGPHHNFLDSFSPHPNPDALISGLGEVHEVTNTSIKKWCVGSPIQAAADALIELINMHDLSSESVESIDVDMHPRSAATINDRRMPNVNLQYIMAVLLVDRTLTFTSVHDSERMNEQSIRSLMALVHVRGDESLPTGEFRRMAKVTVRTNAGESLVREVRHVRGAPGNAMSTEEVLQKALDLMEPDLGHRKARRVAQNILDIEQFSDIGALMNSLRVSARRS